MNIFSNKCTFLYEVTINMTYKDNSQHWFVKMLNDYGARTNYRHGSEICNIEKSKHSAGENFGLACQSFVA